MMLSSGVCWDAVLCSGMLPSLPGQPSAWCCCFRPNCFRDQGLATAVSGSPPSPRHVRLLIADCSWIVSCCT
ncbi:hypothetical protein O3P69_009931 [Scylla paramamosain]|uniref:Secreted protein n=1 Tax=Scylla paramamosain TaxID=85552 RepID=A0AAW0SMM2_SCYPA